MTLHESAYRTRTPRTIRDAIKDVPSDDYVPLEPVTIDTTPTFRDMRVAVRIRDHGLCRFCGEKGNLVVGLKWTKSLDPSDHLTTCEWCRPIAIKTPAQTVEDKIRLVRDRF